MIHSLTGVASNPKCLWGCSVLAFHTLREYIVTASIVSRATAHDKDGDLTRRCALEWSESCSELVRCIPSMCSEVPLVMIFLSSPSHLRKALHSGVTVSASSRYTRRSPPAIVSGALPLDLSVHIQDAARWCAFSGLRRRKANVGKREIRLRRTRTAGAVPE